MRPEFAALAWPNRTAATMLMSRPIKVSTLGEMRVSARPCTMRSRSQPHPRPKALVQVIREISLPLFRGGAVFRLGFIRFVVDGDQFQNLKLALAVGRHDG